jgi:RNA polymerase sigma-70 factor (ECF subfamily)
MLPDETPDEQLLKRAAHGSEEAFAELYRRRQGEIFRFALQMTGSRHVAEEVVQDVFLTVVRSMDTFDAARGSVRAWLYGVARNCVLRHADRNPQTVPLADMAGPEAVDLNRAESIESVRRAVVGLPQPFREAVVLCDLQELSYADAAAVMGVAVGTVRSRLSRGRALLGDVLKSGISRCFV